MSSAAPVRASEETRTVRSHPLVFGTVLFLSSELMFFAALFAAYYDLRANSGAWPPPGVHLDPVEPSIGTVLLAYGSLAMYLATRSLGHANIRAARAWVVSAIIGALGFVGLSLHGYEKAPFTIATNAYGSIYYTLTGFHLMHVLAGIAILCALAAGLRSPALRADDAAGVEAMSYYWHFVFVVWLGVWTTIYFVR